MADGCHHRVGRVLSFFSSRRNWDSPNPSPAGECSAPPPFGSGGRGTLAGERGGGRVPIPPRENTLWYSLFISTLYSAGEDHRGDAGEPNGRPHPSLRWPRHRPCQQGLLQAPQQVVVREAAGR
jgi:hypothetical protein